MCGLIGFIIGILPIIIVDWWLINKYGYPSLSILTVICYKSKWTKWLTFNVWGDDSQYYGKVLSEYMGVKRSNNMNSQGYHVNGVSEQCQKDQQRKVDLQVIQDLESYVSELKEGKLQTYKANMVSVHDGDIFTVSFQFEKVSSGQNVNRPA
jgi:hypothetical protein